MITIKCPKCGTELINLSVHKWVHEFWCPECNCDITICESKDPEDYFDELSKEELVLLLRKYNEYIYNGGEPWDADRQPVCIDEFYDNEMHEMLQELNKTYKEN